TVTCSSWAAIPTPRCRTVERNAWRTTMPRGEVFARLGLVECARELAPILGDELRIVRRQREQPEKLAFRLPVSPVPVATDDLEQLLHRVAIPPSRSQKAGEREARVVIGGIRSEP